eukprot:11649080-Karenia_brevis.AAC.1
MHGISQAMADAEKEAHLRQKRVIASVGKVLAEWPNHRELWGDFSELPRWNDPPPEEWVEHLQRDGLDEAPAAEDWAAEEEAAYFINLPRELQCGTTHSSPLRLSYDESPENVSNGLAVECAERDHDWRLTQTGKRHRCTKCCKVTKTPDLVKGTSNGGHAGAEPPDKLH